MGRSGAATGRCVPRRRRPLPSDFRRLVQLHLQGCSAPLPPGRLPPWGRLRLARCDSPPSSPAGTRRVKPGDGCVMGKRRLSSGQGFTLDPCTRCTCQGSTSVCERQSCPELACPLMHQVHSPDRCCPVCRKPERVRRVCRYLGQTYEVSRKAPVMKGRCGQQ